MNPWLIVGALVALIAVGLGGFSYGDHVGATRERAAALARDNKELTAANAKILDLEEKARATENKHAEAQAKIATVYEGRLADAERQKDLDVAAARAGRVVLRIPSPCKDSGGSAPAQAAPGTGSGDGGASAELPREVTANLLALADDANKVVEQLTACQAVVREDRAR